MKTLATLLLGFALCLSVSAQIEYGKPAELKDLKRVFVDTGADVKLRNDILKEIEKSKLDLEILDSPEGAEIILDFGGGSERRLANVTHDSDGRTSTPTYRRVRTGAGNVFVVKGNKLRVVHSFEDEQKHRLFERKPATNFAREFVKAYKKANGIK